MEERSVDGSRAEPGSPPQLSGQASCLSGHAALVLTGGGYPAALFEIGALVALDEALGSVRRSTSYDLYVGASAGSIVASLLALGLSPQQLRQALLDDAEAPFECGRKTFSKRSHHHSF